MPNSGTFLIRCAACDVTNRISREKLYSAHEAICGHCHRPLTVEGRPRAVTDASFGSDVERSPLPVLLDAWAPWCWPCQMVGPLVEEIGIEMGGRLRVGRLNVDENPSTAARFDISSIPTLLVLERGREIDRIAGVQTKADIARRIARVIRAGSRRLVSP